MDQFDRGLRQHVNERAAKRRWKETGSSGSGRPQQPGGPSMRSVAAIATIVALAIVVALADDPGGRVGAEESGELAVPSASGALGLAPVVTELVDAQRSLGTRAMITPQRRQP